MYDQIIELTSGLNWYDLLNQKHDVPKFEDDTLKAGSKHRLG